jgi:predicted dehydrogenase
MNRRTFLEQCAVGTGLAALPAVHLQAAGKTRIKAGQIGTSHAHAAGKMAAMRKFPEDYEVVGVVEPDAARRAAAEKNPAYQGLAWLTEEQLLGTTGLQAVAVETDVRDLVPTARRCVAAGVHVHLDKPAGESLREFRALLDQATSRRLTVQMGYMLRYNPAFQFCFRAVREGWLGNVFELDTVMSKQIGAAARKGLAEYRGGAMFELGCHVIDAVVSVLGKPQKVTPFARRTHTQSDTLADNQLAVFDYPAATATVRSALIEPGGEQRRQFVVCGEEGVIEIRPLEPPRLSLLLKQARGGHAKGQQFIELRKSTGRYDGEFLDLAAIVRGEKAADFSPQHDLAVHEAILLASGLPANV